MDKKELFALMERFEKSGLAELTWKHDGEEVTFKKGLPLSQRPDPVPSIAGPAAASAPSAAPVVGATTEKITAPLVGTFYRSPAPDAPPFVEKGDQVKKGRTLCILEAMKLMNEFEADFDLEIVEVLAENGSMVEFGTPLFEVRRL